ncbi:MAG: hypothetical protein HRU22_08870 [Gammaproteobacteria bacterium]|nr:hypothetical protein [Gammaproteobacteria bacterium]
MKSIEIFFRKIENFYIAGMLQTGLGLLVGAPGPVTITLLMKKLDDKEKIIATGPC